MVPRHQRTNHANNTGFFKVLNDLLTEHQVAGLKTVYHQGKFYYFSGARYFDASNKMDATKAIHEFKEALVKPKTQVA